jgi:hypothetical protein
MSPWFRRRRLAAASAPEEGAGGEPDEVGGELAEPEPEAVLEPEPDADPTGPLSPDRLDRALKRLRSEISAPSEEGE